VKSGTLLPLAHPALHTADANSFQLTVRGYGSGDLECDLHEDDGSLQPDISTIRLEWKAGETQGVLQRPEMGRPSMYTVARWERVLQMSWFFDKLERRC